ncbi:unnamed protein product [Phytophthora fragariaefolia]|uniref:ATP-dependent DNA helicase n=1 Tax=Phytophthora fragariaefolia TaxID=1490495 RepID=A0A9W6XVQ7_9STRA|nr:unnamed protein product [Phytophthora fragariaefolia]
MERFYLRVLLYHRKGPQSFEHLRTVDGVTYETYRQAALRLGILEDDAEWISCMREAAEFRMPYQLRQLFTTILVYSQVAEVCQLWERFYDGLSQDFAHRAGTGFAHDEQQIRRELEGYGQTTVQAIVDQEDQLNEGQRAIFGEIIQTANESDQDNKLFFIDGPGGTGKSTLLRHILPKVRLAEKIAIAVASSGIATLLLMGGRTAHSTFKIPLKLANKSTYANYKQSHLKSLVQKASLIIWDEAPMTHRHTFEAVDRTLRDITDNDQEPFGGKVFVLSGDFRQILPVVVRGTPAETIDACLKSSALWEHFKQLHLTENMRVRSAGSNSTAAELAAFSEFLLQVGEGRHEVNRSIGRDFVKIPQDMLIDNNDDDREESEDEEIRPGAVPRGLKKIIDVMYADIKGPAIATDDYFANRTILTTTNTVVHRINEAVSKRLSGDSLVYLSIDKVDDDNEENFFEQEVLHSININGIPPHKLTLKKGAPIMMMRNLNPDLGLCNGTRLRIVELKPHVIHAAIMTGKRQGQHVLIPRIVFISDGDTREFPFRLRRKQFPVVPAFAMTINKAQGQTIQNLGLYLATPCFSHEQLYVALSRVTSRSKFKALIEYPELEEDDGVYTYNIFVQADIRHQLRESGGYLTTNFARRSEAEAGQSSSRASWHSKRNGLGLICLGTSVPAEVYQQRGQAPTTSTPYTPEEQWIAYFKQTNEPSHVDYAVVDEAMKQLRMRTKWPEPESRMMNLQADLEANLDRFNLAELAFEHEQRRLVRYLTNALEPASFRCVVATCLTLQENKKFKNEVVPFCTWVKVLLKEFMTWEQAANSVSSTPAPHGTTPSSSGGRGGRGGTSNSAKGGGRSGGNGSGRGGGSLGGRGGGTGRNGTAPATTLPARADGAEGSPVPRRRGACLNGRSGDKGASTGFGADTTLVARGVIDVLQADGVLVHLRRVADQELKPVGSGQLVASRVIQFKEVMLETSAGPLMLRNLECFVDESDPSHGLIVGRPIMKILGYSTDKLLVRARDAQTEWELDGADDTTAPTAEGTTPLQRVCRLQAAAMETSVPRVAASEDVERYETRTAFPTMAPEVLPDLIRTLEQRFKVATEMGLVLEPRARLRAILSTRQDVFRLQFGDDPPVRVAPLQVRLRPGVTPTKS